MRSRWRGKLCVKVFKTPEVARVYIGSFWDEPLHFDTNKMLFEAERYDLFNDLQVRRLSRVCRIRSVTLLAAVAATKCGVA